MHRIYSCFFVCWPAGQWVIVTGDSSAPTSHQISISGIWSSSGSGAPSWYPFPDAPGCHGPAHNASGAPAALRADGAHLRELFHPQVSVCQLHAGFLHLACPCVASSHACPFAPGNPPHTIDFCIIRCNIQGANSFGVCRSPDFGVEYFLLVYCCQKSFP